MNRIAIILILLVYGCQTNDQKGNYITSTSQKDNIQKKLSCSSMPNIFHSYEEAKNSVLNTEFLLSESVNTYKSSWIRAANYYSCDGSTGYFIIRTDKKDYIFNDMPINVWNEFKGAGSYGQYFIQNIKGNYQLILN